MSICGMATYLAKKMVEVMAQERDSYVLRELGIKGWRGAAMLAVQLWLLLEILSVLLLVISWTLPYVKLFIGAICTTAGGFCPIPDVTEVLQMVLDPVVSQGPIRLLVMPAVSSFGLFISLAGYAEMRRMLGKIF
jgi:hypothetical protein